MNLLSENHVLAAITRFFPETGASRLLGARDDDCAFVRVNSPLCVSTDLFVEDVHFRRSYFTPEDVGWKALAVNLSDLAACGAEPVGFSLGLGLPAGMDMASLEGLFRGMAELAERTGVLLTGGDLSRSERLHLCVTVFGEAASPLCRGRARPGDALFLIGEIGLARIGLLRLESEGQSAIGFSPEACAAHLRPLPLLREGRVLHQFALEHPQARVGLMDLSDGLARDVPRLVGLHPSGVIARPGQAPGADLLPPPPHPEVARYCAANELDAEACCLLGGEDYALIGTCRKDFLPLLRQALPAARELGGVNSSAALTCRGGPVSGGFDHFA